MPFHRLLRIDWDVIAGIIAAVAAMLLSFMGVVSETVVRGIMLLLLALLLIRDLRSEGRFHRMSELIDVMRRHVSAFQESVRGPDVKLVGPKRLRAEFVQFSESLYGEVIWFNFCCRMFRRQEIFDAVLRPLIDNPHVPTVRILCQPEERTFWEADVVPKLKACDGRVKILGPYWGPMPGGVSFVLGDVGGDGQNEALLAILAEPFSAPNIGPSVPRYVLRLLSHCDLMVRVEELARHAATSFRSDIEAAAEPAAHP